jgi:hypothetical protein
MCGFVAIRNGLGVDSAGVEYGSNRGMLRLGSGRWRLEARCRTRRSLTLICGARSQQARGRRMASGVETPDCPSLSARLKSCPDERVLKRRRDERRCKSVAISARRRGLFSVSWVIFCLRIRGDHVESRRALCSEKPNAKEPARHIRQTQCRRWRCEQRIRALEYAISFTGRKPVIDAGCGHTSALAPFSGRTQILLRYFRISN